MATNDTFASPEIVEIATNGGTYTSDAIDNTDYTKDEQDPFYPDAESSVSPDGRDAWWSYYPDNSGSTTFELRVADPNLSDVYDYVTIALYQGDTKDALTWKAQDTGSGATNTCKVTYSVTANTHYMIACADRDFYPPNIYTLIVTGRKTPVNRVLPAYITGKSGPAAFTAALDDFEGAERVEILTPGGTFTSTVHVEDLSGEIGEDDLPVGSQYTPSGWWWYVPTASGTLTLTTDGSVPEMEGGGTGDYALAVYTGHSLDSLQAQWHVWGNIDIDTLSDTEDYRNELVMPVTQGVLYFIQLIASPDDAVVQFNATGPVSADPLLIPPADTLLEAMPPLSVSNDSFDYAESVRITSEVGSGVHTGTFTSVPLDSHYYSLEGGEPYFSERSAWWKYEPLVDGTAFFDTRPSTTNWQNGAYGADTTIHILTGSEIDDLTAVEYETAYNWEDPPDSWHFSDSAAVETAVVAGTTYYIRVGDDSSAYAEEPQHLMYVLEVTGPATDNITSVAAPAVDLVVDATEATTSELTLSIVYPETGYPVPTIPISTPVYRVLIQTAGPTPAPTDYELEIRVQDTLDGFATVYTLAPDAFELVTNPMLVTVPSTVPLDPSDYVVQARLTYLGHTFDWIPGTTSAFRIEEETQYDTTVSWSVGADSPTPHLWFIDPPRAEAGQQVAIYGHGMTVSTGTVTVAGVSATVNSWTKISATAATTARTIDPQTLVVDPEHYKIVVTVPSAADPPGGPVVVST